MGWKNYRFRKALQKDHEALKEKNRDAQLAGSFGHTFIQRYGPVGTYYCECSCGWASAEREHSRLASEEDWHRHFQYVKPDALAKFQEQKERIADELARQQYEKEQAGFQSTFDAIRKRYQRP